MTFDSIDDSSSSVMSTPTLSTPPEFSSDPFPSIYFSKEFPLTAYSTKTSIVSQEKSLRVECQARTRIPTPYGEFFLHLYKNNHDSKEHLAIVFGDDIRSTTLDAVQEGETETDRIIRGAYHGRLNPNKTNQVYRETSSTSPLPPLVRIHSECFTGETVHSVRCDCGDQLEQAMRLMHDEGRGVVVYLRQEGRGIGLLEKIKAYNLQDLGYDTVSANVALSHPPDLRTYDVACEILKDLNIPTIRLLTNNPDKIEQLEEGGLKVTERVPMIPKEWSVQCETQIAQKRKNDDGYTEVDTYLKTKVERMRHLIDIPTIPNVVTDPLSKKD
ncbi:GTP cyclohydrolase II [Basidiobolus ranarum]|uniref:GTP cyclohydrolase II n=1 Tax=Basidiobolus ranarum TaxID=34480 RepID=A0ABR2WAF8_9FUNG